VFQTITISGSDYEIKTFALTTTEQDIKMDNGRLKTVVMQARGEGANVRVKRKSGDTAFFTLKAGSSLSMNFAIGDFVCRARTGGGTATLEVIASF